MKFNWLLILFFTLSFFNAQQTYAQTKYTWLDIPDSVINDRQLLVLMRERIKEAVRADVYTAITQLKTERQKAEKDSDSLKISCGYYIMASIHDYSGDYSESIELYKKAAIWLKFPEHEWFASTLYSKTGYALSRISEYDSSLTYYSKSLKIREKLQYGRPIIHCEKSW